MNKTRFFVILVLLAALIASGHKTARAAPNVPPNPSSFYGEIHIISGDGEPNPGVDYIEAYVPGRTTYAARILITTSGSDPVNVVYAINVPGDDDDTPGEKEGGVENDVVTFRINERIVATGVWHGGTNVRLNIHPPAAYFGGSNVGVVKETINFGVSATDWLTTDTFMYAWDLDGDTAYDDSTVQTPSYTFTTTGIKTVGVKVTDSKGGVDILSATVVVVDLGGLTGQAYDGTPKSVSVNGLEVPYTAEVSYDGSPTAPTNAGSYSVVVTIKNGTTDVGTINKTLVIDPKAIIVSADNGQTKVFGAADPTFTYTSSDPGAPFIGALSREPGTDIGSYAITIGGLTAGSNYSITFVPANFTITAKPIIVTADIGQTKVYGAADPTFFYTSSDPGAPFTGALGRDPGATVGSYAITIGSLTAGSNYSITFVAANFTITAKPIIVTADNKSKVVGAGDAPLTYQVTDGELETGDSFTGDLDRVDGEAVGTYDILQGMLSAGSNYNITFVKGTFTINPLQHTISLVQGWNLVSIDLIPTDPAIGVVLASIDGNFDLVYAWDANVSSNNWLKYDNIELSPDTLSALTEKMGFWIHMITADDLVVSGNPLPPPTTGTSINLWTTAGGWNLVGYPDDGSLGLPGALEDHGVINDNYTLVYAFHAADTVDPWKLYDKNAPGYANDLTSMSPGWGYWIFVNTDVVWKVGN